jgi:hypothetical protein
VKLQVPGYLQVISPKDIKKIFNPCDGSEQESRIFYGMLHDILIMIYELIVLESIMTLTCCINIFDRLLEAFHS